MNLFYLLLFIGGGLLAYRSILFAFVLIPLFIILKNQRKLLIIGVIIFCGGYLTLFGLKLLSGYSFQSGLALVTKTGSNYYIVLTKVGRFYVSHQAHNLFVGDLIYLEGSKDILSFPHLEGDFNYAQYLMNKGIYAAFSPTVTEIKLRSFLRFTQVINFNGKTYPSHLDGIKSLLLVRDINYDDPLIKTLSSYNTLYVLMLSGVHLSFLRRAFRRGLALFVEDKLSDHLSYLILLPFFVFNITKFAFYRIFVTKIFRILNFRQTLTNLELNVVVATFFLFINPYFIFEASFYLAYLFIFAFTLYPFKRGMGGKLAKTGLFYFLLSSYLLLSSRSIPLVSFVYPLLITPLISLWYLLYLCTLPLPFLGNIAVTVLNIIYHFLTTLSTFNITLHLPFFSMFLRILFVMIIICLLFCQSIKLKPVVQKFSFLLIYLILLSYLPFDNFLSYSVTFINVGQGDAALFKMRGKSVLIDTGGLYHRDIATEVLIPFLYQNRVYELDYVFITHDDYDHNGALASLKEAFPVRHIYTSAIAFPLTIGGVTFTNLNERVWGDDNLNSLIFYVPFPSFNLLLMGDAGIENEKLLIEDYPALKVDILKVGHHGSNTSSSEAFIAHYRPPKVVISVGANNRYGHPHQSVLDIFSKYGAQIYRTDVDGSITFKEYVAFG